MIRGGFQPYGKRQNRQPGQALQAMLAGRNPYLSSPSGQLQLPPFLQGAVSGQQSQPSDPSQAPNPGSPSTGLPFIPSPGNYRFRLPVWNPLSVRRSSLRR